MNVALRRPMSQADFFMWAESQEGRYEFDGVQPVAMVGGSNSHGSISSNLVAQLWIRLRGSPCRPMGALGGGVATVGRTIRYPDASVTCSPVRGQDRLLPDPVTVFEVLSPTSWHTDLTIKPIEYAAVASIRRYVVVEQSRIEVRGWERTEAGDWVPFGPLHAGATLDLPEIGIVLPLSDIYEDVTDLA